MARSCFRYGAKLHRGLGQSTQWLLENTRLGALEIRRMLHVLDVEISLGELGPLGGDTLAADAQVTAPFGEIQAYGYVAGKKPFDLFSVKHSIAIKTFSADDFFATPMFPAATVAMHEWFQTGKLLEASVILPLEEVAEANRLLERGEVLGKIALRP